MKHIKKINEGFRDRKKAELEAEIKRKQEELQGLDSNEPADIVDLEEYTTEDKVKFFDEMYKMAKDYIDKLEETGYKDDDWDNWFFEAGVTILNTKDKNKFWKYHRSISG